MATSVQLCKLDRRLADCQAYGVVLGQHAAALQALAPLPRRLLHPRQRACTPTQQPKVSASRETSHASARIIFLGQAGQARRLQRDKQQHKQIDRDTNVQNPQTNK